MVDLDHMADPNHVAIFPPAARSATPPSLTPPIQPKRKPWLVGLVVALLGLGAFGTAIRLLPAQPGAGGSTLSPSAGSGALGAGPGVGLLASAPAVGQGGGVVGPTLPIAVPVESTLGARSTISADPGGVVAPLKASYVAAAGLTSQTVTVTVANPARVDQSWYSAVMRLEGVTLVVSTADPNVTYKTVGRSHCFFAKPSIAVVHGGKSVSFTVTVSGLLERTAEVAIDQPECP